MKTEKKRSFRGAVLLTVVSVMSLLIVFLTSTLVLATAANNRAHKSYSSSQASYTARAAIDSILAAAKQDENFAIAMNSLKDGGKLDVDVSVATSTPGIGKVDNAVITYAGKKQFYDKSTQSWVERDLLSITADVTSGGETKTVTAYVLKDPPKPGGGGGGGGGFVTVGTVGADINHTVSFGGTYFGIGMSKGQRYYQGDYNLPFGQIVSLEDKLYLNRIDNKPGVIGDDGMLIPNLPETTDADKIVTYTFRTGDSIEAPAVINGNCYSNTGLNIYFPDVSTGLSVWGNMTFQNSTDLNFIANPNMTPTKFNEIPYFYVDSLLNTDSGSDFNLNNNNRFPLNIFCGSIRLKQASIGADIYCQDSNKTSVLSCTQNTQLYNWSKSVVTGTEGGSGTFTGGNFYSKGSVIVEGGGNTITINGDMVVEGDLEVTGKLKVTGALVVGGTLKCDGELDVTGNISATYATGSKFTIEKNGLKTKGDGSPLYTEESSTPKDYIYIENFKLKHNEWSVQDFQGIAALVPDDMANALISGKTSKEYPRQDNSGNKVVYDLGGIEIEKSLLPDARLCWEKKAPNLDPVIETVWRNTEDNTTTTNESDVYNVNFKYNGKDIGSPELYKAVHNNELFPRKAEKAVILGLEDMDGNTFNYKDEETLKSLSEEELKKYQKELKEYQEKIKNSKVLKTVEELETEYNFSTKAITKIDSSYLADVNTNVYDNSTLPSEITSSCTLTGGFSRDIKIKGSAGIDIWVKLDNFSIQAGHCLEYDDSEANCGNLNIFIANNATFEKSPIYTKTYKDWIENHTKFQIATKKKLYVDEATGGEKAKCPKINIYSAPTEYEDDGITIKRQPKLNMSSGGAIVTAAIEAPNLQFELLTAKELDNVIHYNGRKISEAKGYNGRVGVIGILNVAEASSLQNEWVFLYTPRDAPEYDNDDDPNKVSKEFDIMYYDGF